MTYEWASWQLPALLADPVVAPKVIVVPGHETRGRPPSQFSFFPSGILEHHTACMCRIGHDPQSCIDVIVSGHGTTPGPISQLLGTFTRPGTKWTGSNADPHIVVIADGRANHAGSGEYSWGAPSGNGSSIGVEWCIEAGTPVVTRRGLVPIEDVKIGDLVWTHRGRWRPVSAVHDRGERDTVTIKAVGARPVSTPEHEWWTGRDFVRADRLGPDDALVSPAVTDAAVPDLDGFTVTPELLRFIGAYVADGCTSIIDRPRKPGHLRKDHRLIVYPRAEKAEVVAGWARAAGLNIRNEHSHADTARRLTVESKALVEFVDYHFGSRALNKTLPSWLLANADKYGEAFLHGYLHGDGHWDEERSAWQVATSSRCLHVGVAMLARSLGWTAITASRHIEGEKIIHGRITRGNADRWTQRLYARPVRRWSSSQRRDSDATLAPFRTTEAAGLRHVYDITVDDDHSFVADGFLTHNCGPVDDWPDEVIDFRAHVTAALLRNRRWNVGNVDTHYSYARPIGRKIDPSGAWAGEPTLGLTQPWARNTWRSQVDRVLNAPAPPPPSPDPEPPITPKEIPDMLFIAKPTFPGATTSDPWIVYYENPGNAPRAERATNAHVKAAAVLGVPVVDQDSREQYLNALSTYGIPLT